MVLMPNHAYEQGAIICHQGTLGDSMYVLNIGGEVRVGQTSVVIRAPAYFGEITFSKGIPRTATITAETMCECLVLTREVYARVIGPVELDWRKYSGSDVSERAKESESLHTSKKRLETEFKHQNKLHEMRWPFVLRNETGRKIFFGLRTRSDTTKSETRASLQTSMKQALQELESGEVAELLLDSGDVEDPHLSTISDTVLDLFVSFEAQETSLSNRMGNRNAYSCVCLASTLTTPSFCALCTRHPYYST